LFEFSVSVAAHSVSHILTGEQVLEEICGGGSVVEPSRESEVPVHRWSHNCWLVFGLCGFARELKGRTEVHLGI
jgi:hypothetical protein